MNAFIHLLHDRDQFIGEIVDGRDLRKKLKQLTAISGAALAVYGLVIGSQHSFLQGLSSGVKLPTLFLLTIAICMPALHIFSSLFGSKRSALQTFVLLLGGTSTMAISLAGLAPVAFFFIVTTDSYQFFKLLNVLFFSVAGLLGVLFMNRSHARFNDGRDGLSSTRSLLLRFWFVLYAFVGTQLAWTLRPFFGEPTLPFEVVREFGGNFYTDVINSVAHLLGP